MQLLFSIRINQPNPQILFTELTATQAGKEEI